MDRFDYNPESCAMFVAKKRRDAADRPIQICCVSKTIPFHVRWNRTNSIPGTNMSAVYCKPSSNGARNDGTSMNAGMNMVNKSKPSIRLLPKGLRDISPWFPFFPFVWIFRLPLTIRIRIRVISGALIRADNGSGVRNLLCDQTPPDVHLSTSDWHAHGAFLAKSTVLTP
jgi:hypothetical protein